MPTLLLLLALQAPPPTSRDALEARFRTIAASAGGEVGVSVLHLETGRGASLHGHERFPMASVFKLPLAVAFLARVDRGALRLEQTVALGPADMRPTGPLSERAPNGGLTLSLKELLEAMLVESDNSAADVLLPLAGGPEVVTARLDEAGLGDIRVDRSEAELAFDSFGVSPYPPRAQWTLSAIRRAIEASPDSARREAVARFLADPRDTATPDALVQLLRQIDAGRGLSKESRALLLELMTRTRVGGKRIRAGVPPGAAVAHRTGTGADVAGVSIVTNDVGIVTLPQGRGRLAMAVMIKNSTKSLAEREAAIAEIARAACRYWMP
ncbi:MAG TPA: class A beta-lactamase [Thermoanaerobaculia bacterium]|nr:class A beta-lactamase [Thermoanaerobaculia bacterium]